ncbi:non-histone chromosomal protein 6 [Streptomyces sp. NBC_00690]|uniref:non-histone chromosomal protein 6 n=1 Tax=Streptomyces sp. NBC_00690 TaxID=2975808 RepID=UPI002E2A7CB8|nr:non-histone chromosomal protein 6 [Streptomyces sp. NBC_00690]
MTSETTKTTAKDKTRARGKKDPHAPKRALSAYMFYSQDHRERVKQANPDASFSETGRILGNEWRSLSDTDRRPYEERAARDKSRADAEMEAYEARHADD